MPTLEYDNEYLEEQALLSAQIWNIDALKEKLALLDPEDPKYCEIERAIQIKEDALRIVQEISSTEKVLTEEKLSWTPLFTSMDDGSTRDNNSLIGTDYEELILNREYAINFDGIISNKSFKSISFYPDGRIDLKKLNKGKREKSDNGSLAIKEYEFKYNIVDPANELHVSFGNKTEKCQLTDSSKSLVLSYEENELHYMCKIFKENLSKLFNFRFDININDTSKATIKVVAETDDGVLFNRLNARIIYFECKNGKASESERYTFTYDREAEDLCSIIRKINGCKSEDVKTLLMDPSRYVNGITCLGIWVEALYGILTDFVTKTNPFKESAESLEEDYHQKMAFIDSIESLLYYSLKEIKGEIPVDAIKKRFEQIFDNEAIKENIDKSKNQLTRSRDLIS